MALQLHTDTRNAMLDAIETQIGTAPTLRIRTGSAPADCAAADSGSVLVAITLPSDWLANASGGSKTKAGTWAGTAAGDGTAGHFRVYDSGGQCRMQGSVGQGSGDLSLDNVSIASGQSVTISSASLSAGNA